MDQQDKKAAAAHAARAGSQAKHAVKNAGRAVEDVAEPVLEAAEEKAGDAVSFVKAFLPDKRQLVGLTLAAIGGALIYDGVKGLQQRKKLVTSVPPVPPTV